MNSLIKNLDSAKAEDIKCIDIKKKSSYANYLIIATCRSAKHASAIAEDLVKKLKNKGIFCSEPEGKPKCDWTIIDAGDVIVHLFRPEIRMHYNIEKFWETGFDTLKKYNV